MTLAQLILACNDMVGVVLENTSQVHDKTLADSCSDYQRWNDLAARGCRERVLETLVAIANDGNDFTAGEFRDHSRRKWLFSPSNVQNT
ncbi:hypothetical protein SUGI_0861160 [Cryptomeria japonica]|nr:hypothetical protein SUGI_0861160 [Cryptomeria japonica]